MTEEDEAAIKDHDKIMERALKRLETQYFQQGEIPESDLPPRLLWLASAVIHCHGRMERRARLTRLMACALAWIITEEQEAKRGGS